ncbi:hypothetical protein ACWGH4_28045, partial [Streptomyces sp. NPDC054847]
VYFRTGLPGQPDFRRVAFSLGARRRAALFGYVGVCLVPLQGRISPHTATLRPSGSRRDRFGTFGGRRWAGLRGPAHSRTGFGTFG